MTRSTYGLTNVKLVDLRSILLLILFWIVAAVVVDPRAAFPLDDDWAYSDTAEPGPGVVRLAFEPGDPNDALSCRTYRPWIGPRVAAICARELNTP